MSAARSFQPNKGVGTWDTKTFVSAPGSSQADAAPNLYYRGIDPAWADDTVDALRTRLHL